MMKMNGLVAGCLLVCAASAAGGKSTPFRFIAAEQASATIGIYEERPGEAPVALWLWSAQDDLNAAKDAGCFANPSECKVREDGKTIIMSASGGGAAGIDVKTGKCKWYVYPGGNPHSVEVLPDGRVAVASSTGATLTIIDVKDHPFDPSKQTAKTVLQLPSGHGVHWDAERKSLFALGLNTLFELDYDSAAMSVSVRRQWDFKKMHDETYGHDLVPDGKGGYFFTTHHFVWRVDPEMDTIEKARDLADVKGFSPSATGDLVTLPQEQWWTDTLFVLPSGSSDTNLARKITLPGAKFYKARHFPYAVESVFDEEENEIAAAWSYSGTGSDKVLTNSVSGWAFKIDQYTHTTLSSVLPSLTNNLANLTKDLDLTALDGEHRFSNGQTYTLTTTGSLFQNAPDTLKAAVETVKFPKTLTTISRYAFSTLITIPSVKFIGCPNLRFVKFSKALTSIGTDAFRNCAEAEFDFGGSSPSSVGQGAFAGTKLREVAFTNTVTLSCSNGSGFSGAGSLVRVELPQVTTFLTNGSSVKNMFDGCSSLEHLILPNITSLGSSFIRGASKLNALKLPWCMGEITEPVFDYREDLPQLLVHSESQLAEQGTAGIATTGDIKEGAITFYGGTTQDGWVYDDAVWNEETKKYDIQSDIVTIVAAPNATGAVEIPKDLNNATVTAIEACAFKNNTGLTCVTVPKTVTRIGVAAFPEGCYIKVKNSPHAQRLVDQLNDWYKMDADGKPYASIDAGRGLIIRVK